MPDLSKIKLLDNETYNIKDLISRAHATDADRITTEKTKALYKISVTAEGHVKDVEVVGITDNTTSMAPDISDTNLITGRTLANAIASISEIESLFPGQSEYSDYATAEDIAALFN